ncbi:MAG: KamA family radical SAM protein [Sphaerochaetaceae bacterium]
MQTCNNTAIITSRDALQRHLRLSEDERSFNESLPSSLPMKIPTYFLSLINPEDPNDPLRRQVIPTGSEQIPQGQGTQDPLQEIKYSVTDRLIHRYESRVAFLTTDICPMHCRHCFRRRFTGTFQGPATKVQIEKAALYVETHPKITEILFTGGDVLTLSDACLEAMIRAFRDKRPDLIIRICTRMPASFPMRITENLITMLKRFPTAPFYLMCQFNHPRELTPQAIEAIDRFIDAGIPAMNQTVLLHGVNDDVEVLAELCNRLLAHRIKPYYLFQGDLVEGTAHFRVPLEKGFAIEEALRKRLSGLAMPLYAIDLPEGGGKVPLGRNYLLGKSKEGQWMFRNIEGEIRTYPDPINVEQSDQGHLG